MDSERNIFEVTVDHFLAPIKEFMDDPEIAEIMINTWDEIYVEKQGRLTLTDAKFADSNAMLAADHRFTQTQKP